MLDGRTRIRVAGHGHVDVDGVIWIVKEHLGDSSGAHLVATNKHNISDETRAELCELLPNMSVWLQVLATQTQNGYTAGPKTIETIWRHSLKLEAKAEGAPDAAEDDYGPEAWRQVADTAARHPNSPDELTLTHFLGAGVGDNWTEERRRLAADLLREGWAGTTQELIEVVEAT